MNGAEHYQRAERLANDGLAVVAAIHATQDEGRRDALGKQVMGIWAQAQVHATLSLTAATASLLMLDTEDDWKRVLQ